MIFLRKYKKYLHNRVNQKIYNKTFKDADLQCELLSGIRFGFHSVSTIDFMKIFVYGNIAYTYRYNANTNEIKTIQLAILYKYKPYIKIIEFNVNSDIPEIMIENYHRKYSLEYIRHQDLPTSHITTNRICLCNKDHTKIKHNKTIRNLVL